jgi:hypothetical protein
VLAVDGLSSHPPPYVLVGHALYRSSSSNGNGVGPTMTSWRQEHCVADQVEYETKLRARVVPAAGCRVAAVGAALVATSDGRVRAVLDPSGPIQAVDGTGALAPREWSGVRIGELHSKPQYQTRHDPHSGVSAFYEADEPLPPRNATAALRARRNSR